MKDHRVLPKRHPQLAEEVQVNSGTQVGRLARETPRAPTRVWPIGEVARGPLFRGGRIVSGILGLGVTDLGLPCAGLARCQGFQWPAQGSDIGRFKD